MNKRQLNSMRHAAAYDSKLPPKVLTRKEVGDVYKASVEYSRTHTNPLNPFGKRKRSK